MQVNYNSYEYTATSVKFSYQSGTAAQPQQAEESKEANSVQNKDAATFVPSKDAADASQRAALIDSMKASLQRTQQSLFDTVNQLLSQQGMTARVGEGAWKVFAEGNFQVDAATKTAAQQAISEDGEWGVKKTSERLFNFAKALVGGDPSKVATMRDAVKKGFEAAKKAWGGELPEISQRTYDATMKLFDEWEKGGSSDAPSLEEAKAQTKPQSSYGLSFSFEYTRVETRSVSFTASNDDADWLQRSGILSDVSDPLRLNGMQLNSSWCMNERVSVSFNLDRSDVASNAPVKPGQDGFVRRNPDDSGAYGPNGRVRNDHGPHRGPHGGRRFSIDFIRPVETPKDGQKTVKVGDQEIPLHDDGTVTVALSDGTLRHAKVNQEALDRMAREPQHDDGRRAGQRPPRGGMIED